ncbi:hypothetical protein ACEQPO_11060 [Bacillus sp. SL00103]
MTKEELEEYMKKHPIIYREELKPSPTFRTGNWGLKNCESTKTYRVVTHRQSLQKTKQCKLRTTTHLKVPDFVIPMLVKKMRT